MSFMIFTKGLQGEHEVLWGRLRRLGAVPFDANVNVLQVLLLKQTYD